VIIYVANCSFGALTCLSVCFIWVYKLSAIWLVI